jgi:hypothetical protein
MGNDVPRGKVAAPPNWVLDYFDNNYYVALVNNPGLNLLEAGLSDDRVWGGEQPTTGEGR